MLGLLANVLHCHIHLIYTIISDLFAHVGTSGCTFTVTGNISSRRYHLIRGSSHCNSLILHVIGRLHDVRGAIVQGIERVLELAQLVLG